MSIELIVFAPEPLTDLSLLDEYLDLGGWVARFVDGSGALREVSIPEAEFVLGIPVDSAEAEEAATLDASRVRALYESHRIASVEFSEVTVDPSDAPSPEKQLASWDKAHLAQVADEEAPAHLRAKIRDARVVYVVRTSGGRNERDPDFQTQLWVGIAATTIGIAYDPETSEFHDTSETDDEL